MKESPWNFSAIHVSPDKRKRFIYKGVGEIAMGAPLSGVAILEKGKKAYNVHGSAGGPPVWSDDSRYIAVPVWSSGRSAMMGLIDTEELNIRIFRKPHGVLTVKYFDGEEVVASVNPLQGGSKIRIPFTAFGTPSPLEVIE